MQTPKQGCIPGIEEDDDDDSCKDEEEQEYGRKEQENVGSVASPRPFHDTQYRSRKDGEQLMIGESPVVINTRNNFAIKVTAFRGKEGSWKLFTRKNVNTDVIGNADLKRIIRII